MRLGVEFICKWIKFTNWSYNWSYLLELFIISIHFLFELLNLDKSAIKKKLNLSVALKISYILHSASELQDGILKTTKYLCLMGVFDSIKLQMLKRVNYVPTLFPTQVYVLTAFHSCEHVSLWRACALSHSLLSLVFTIRWNQKHPSYVSIRLVLEFCCEIWAQAFPRLHSWS